MADTERRFRWLTYQGVEVLYHDYRGLNEASAVAQVRAVTEMVLSTNKRGFAELVNLTGLKLTRAFVDAGTEASEAYDERVTSAAVVGVGGVRELVLKFYNNFAKVPLRPFKSEAEALTWLANQAQLHV